MSARSEPTVAWRGVAIVVACKFALHVAVASRYGWQRDELYYAVAGRHLQGGYVEFPPVTALLSGFAHFVFGWSLVGFRLFAILAGAGTVVVAALVARELGGGRRAQVIAAGAVPFEQWATARRLKLVGAAFAIVLLLALPIGLPVLPLHTADRVGVLAARSDYQDEVGWPRLASDVGRLSHGTDAVLASNYGEAGALELFGHGLPPVASPHVTFRYWRPDIAGRRVLLVGFTKQDAFFCLRYRRVARIAMPVDNEERGLPIADCSLRRSLAALWPRLVARYG